MTKSYNDEKRQHKCSKKTKKCHTCRRKFKFYKFEGHSIIIIDCEKQQIAKNPINQTPYIVWFVNNASVAPGNGTYESPFVVLSDAESNSASNDIIYVFPGDTTDKGQNTGITLKQGQQLLSVSVEQKIETSQGCIHIPAITVTKPTLSNTNNAVGQPLVGKAAVTLINGDNVVSGFIIVDNIGGGIIKDGGGISGGVRVDDKLNYIIKYNTITTFANTSFPAGFQGGNCVNIFGGGNVSVKDNILLGRDQGDCFGVVLRSRTTAHQGYFIIENNKCSGVDNNSGLSVGIRLTPKKLDSGGSHGITGDLVFSVVKNICDSQKNNDIGLDTAGIQFDTVPNLNNSIKATIIGNYVTLPSGIIADSATAGIRVTAAGPGGPTIVSLHENVCLTNPPVPGFLFQNNGNPAYLVLDMGFDNFGSSVGP